jgi:hypothetical protein
VAGLAPIEVVLCVLPRTSGVLSRAIRLHGEQASASEDTTIAGSHRLSDPITERFGTRWNDMERLDGIAWTLFRDASSR